MKTALNIVKAYCSEKSVDFHEMEHMTVADLVTFLRKFYVSVRNQKGEYYSKKSMISLRYGLQRHFLKIREIDIVNNADFKAANDMFNAMLIKLKQVGMGVSVHKPAINSEDIGKLYNCLDLNTPTGLQSKVFLDFMLFFL